MYPVKVLVVMLHEISHAMAALITGGSVVRIELTAREGGLAVTQGGSRFLILSAGYLGSMAWGSALLVAAARSKLDRALVALLGASLLLVTLAYVRTPFGILYGLAAGIVLLAVGWKLPAAASDLCLQSIGVVSCLYAVQDIASDLVFRSVKGSDASALAELTHVPALVWALLWMGASLATAAVVVLLLRRRTAPRAAPEAS